jgi:tetratricopeptide (TPR) repeat protein
MSFYSNYKTKRLIITTILFISLANLSFGQVRGIPTEATDSGLGGSNTIEGSVFLASGQRLERRVRVRLTTMTRGDTTSTTDDSGRFAFRGLPGGDYIVAIDGEQEFEPFSQRVNIIQLRGSPPQNYMLSVRLVLKNNAEPKAGVVNAELADIPPKAVDFYKKALELSKQKDHKGAVEQLQSAVTEYSDFMLGYNEMGYQYMKLNDYENAAKAFEAALKIKADAILPLTNYGITLSCLNKFSESEKVLKQAIKINEKLPIAHYYLAYSIANQNRFDEAEKEFLLAAKLGGPEMKEAHRYLAIIYSSKGNKKRQIEELETYLLLAPTAADAEQLRKLLQQLKGK